MKKYGIENFSVQLLEQCPREDLNKREVYWIKYYDSYHNGYNATLGGDGALIYNEDTAQQILSIWNSNIFTNITDIHNILHIDTSVIKSILTDQGVSKEEIDTRASNKVKKPVQQLDLRTNEVVCTYASACEAGLAMNKNRSGKPHIIQVCNGIRKTAYGYKWRYLD